MSVQNQEARTEDSWHRFVQALARTSLPGADTTSEFSERTLQDSRINAMFDDLVSRFGWRPADEMQALKWHRGEDMLWLWCMYSLWVDSSCHDLLDVTCRPGWPQLTNGKRFDEWHHFRNAVNGRRQRDDIACFLGAETRPYHAFFCELKFLKGSPRSQHEDESKIRAARPDLPVWWVLVEGSISKEVVATRSEFELRPGDRVARLFVTSGGASAE